MLGRISGEQDPQLTSRTAYSTPALLTRALALDEAIESLGYTGLYAYGHTEALTMWLAIPEMITRFIMEASDLEACIARDEKHQTNHLHNDHGEWQEMQQVKVGCIKKKGYEEGIPMWMVSVGDGVVVWRLRRVG